MIGESSHSNSTASPQYEDIIQELASLCIASSSSSTTTAPAPACESFFQGE
eukprot:CAMPEP_0113645968 /NCGR_PEP_ID=MMETSP0017_2-20120614/24253_1 /TAXON_ID=2856 /ORGANISM="Cylindrotheca closterium" /LENGTH=50 /DNA_ID=CAMNT_0000557779 /DNA_START=169 /DNA_END=318 /DNA_ORIENTATION=+ /assembly_acc=CAM_ASM_000147